MNDTPFLGDVLELAARFGWLRFHARPALTQSGEWRTAMSGEVGFPDLTLVHARRGQLLFVEVKSERSKLTDDQESWLYALRSAGCAAELWRPSNLEYATWRLGPKGRPPRLGHSVDAEPHGRIEH